ncbi:MAG: IS256 family transposase [Actinomycetota bacterium]|nr:IS256 family transposase [Actinomycetota bacterium]
MKKVPPSRRIRKELGEILEKGMMEGNLLSEFLLKGMQLMMQEMLETEVTDFLEREHYERKREGPHRGYRNGYEPAKVRSAEGEVRIELPQVRDNVEFFSSKLKEFFRGNTDCLEKLTAEMYARGLSTRDIEDALFEATGDMILSKSSVSRVTEILWEEFELFKERDLSSFEVEYLFLDAIYESVRRLSGMKEAILVSWAILRDGRKVLLSLSLGNKESHSDWLEFLRDMVRRGLKNPLSVTSDGAPGLIRAIEEIFPKSLRIRCWVHKIKNLSSKVPPAIWPEIKAEILQVRDAATYTSGKELALNLIEKYEREYPSLISSFSEDLEALLSHLKLPVRHRKSIRTTNLIERSFVEEKRRTKVIPGFWTERSCLKLVFSCLIKASRRWRRVPMDKIELKRIDALRRELELDERPIEKESMAKEAVNV